LAFDDDDVHVVEGLAHCTAVGSRPACRRRLRNAGVAFILLQAQALQVGQRAQIMDRVFDLACSEVNRFRRHRRVGPVRCLVDDTEQGRVHG